MLYEDRRKKQFQSSYEKLLKLVKDFDRVEPYANQALHYVVNSYRSVDGKTPRYLHFTISRDDVSLSHVFFGVEEFPELEDLVCTWLMSQLDIFAPGVVLDEVVYYRREVDLLTKLLCPGDFEIKSRVASPEEFKLFYLCPKCTMYKLEKFLSMEFICEHSKKNKHSKEHPKEETASKRLKVETKVVEHGLKI